MKGKKILHRQIDCRFHSKDGSFLSVTSVPFYCEVGTVFCQKIRSYLPVEIDGELVEIRHVLPFRFCEAGTPLLIRLWESCIFWLLFGELDLLGGGSKGGCPPLGEPKITISAGHNLKEAYEQEMAIVGT